MIRRNLEAISNEGKASTTPDLIFIPLLAFSFDSGVNILFTITMNLIYSAL